jgi:hypothetical protein
MLCCCAKGRREMRDEVVQILKPTTVEEEAETSGSVFAAHYVDCESCVVSWHLGY